MTEVSNEEQSNNANVLLAVRCNLTKDEEIGLYEKFLDEFTDKDGVMKPCNPDAIFNWFGWQLWRSKQLPITVLGLGEGGLVGCSILAEFVCPLLPNMCYAFGFIYKL